MSRSDGDDTHMHAVSRLAGTLGAVICVMAAGVMSVASYLPYTGWYGDGLLTGNEVPSQITVNIVAGSGVWVVLGTVVTLGFVAGWHLAGVHRRVTALIALGAASASLGLALKLPGTWTQDGVVSGQPYYLDAGFYVFLAGAVTAVIDAVLMVLGGSVGVHRKAETPPLLPSPS